ncbi:ATP-binding cassette domain-containing protein [Candidatus Bipolaricaulota bacterium]|nr:ATP-binding cassette domain-containing protein [Candidatus Bipolaricaulota bacterium]
MALLQIEQLEKSFGMQTLFAPFSVAIARGERIALIGENGTGKSTLLSIIAEWEEATKGGIHRAQGTRIAYLPQVTRLEQGESLIQAMHRPFAALLEIERELRQLEKVMTTESPPEVLHRYDELLHDFERRDGYTIESKIRSVLTGVGFQPEEFSKPTSLLSGGEEARAALARVLLEEADLLLLDEPTNHLDFAALDWLEETLIAFPGALILVSHDRRLLDRVTNHTWEVAFEELTMYRSGYTRSRMLREAERNRRRELAERQQATIERHKEFVRRHHAGQKYRQAKDRERKIERIEKDLLERPGTTKQISLSIPIGDVSGKKVLTIENLVIGYDTPLITCPEFTLYSGERVAIIGENGCGKTTLLKTIIDEASPLAGTVRLGHGVRPVTYTQDQSGLHGKGTVLDAILSRSNLTIGQARGLLGRFLFSGDTVMKKMSALSGGERSRVALAALSLMAGNLLLFDEPTNHLDIVSQEILEQALLDYEGTIILVSHDRALLESVTTQVWNIENGMLRVFACGYQEYKDRYATKAAGPLTERTRIAQSPTEQSLTKQARAKKGRSREAKADKYGLKRHVEAVSVIEKTIEEMEKKLHQIEAEIVVASECGDGEKIAELGKSHHRLTRTLGETYAEWEKLSTGTS